MKIVLAYSGGLDTSVLMSWIKEKYKAEMIGFCADIGQEEELDGLEAKAIKTGASKIYIDNLQEEFARDFIYPIIQASAIYEGQYFLGTSIARPLIAKRMVEIAKKERQRSSALRTHRRRARARLASHRPMARRTLSRRISRSPADD